MEILVFKTNLNNADRVAAIGANLNVHPRIAKWNVDIEDCDKVLRIVSDGIVANEVEKIVLGAGYYCEELM